MRLQRITEQLCEAVDALRFGPPITHVYNPLVYARAPHFEYLKRYGKGRKEALFLGMNPGPWGMAQTGVPFGEVAIARGWLQLERPVDRPEVEHPKRPVQGFDCTRSEVSGRRLWGWAADRFGTPERFFARFFIVNYCPLVFMEESGKNFTPDKLPVAERAPLFAACDDALREVVRVLRPERVIGVGAFAEKKAHDVLGATGVTIGRILHPSPASPIANRGWAEAAEKQLAEQGVAV